VKKHVCYDPKVALLVMQYMCCKTIMFILLRRPSTKVCWKYYFFSWCCINFRKISCL